MRLSETVVLIPHFNNPSGILKSIKSIKEKEPMDVLIVDDGSVNGKIDEDFLKAHSPKSVSLIFQYLHSNLGIEHALNKGLEYISNTHYKYIARLDCGDICVPNRFLIQRTFLNDHPEIAMVGSFVKFFDMEGKHVFDLKLPMKHEQIKKKMYINAMFIHPTIMFRKEIIDKIRGYSTRFKAAEDYDFFFRIIRHYEVANLDQFLVHCEMNPSGISIKKRRTQVYSRIKLIVANFYFGLYPIYGLLRNLIIYILPYRFILLLKKAIK